MSSLAADSPAGPKRGLLSAVSKVAGGHRSPLGLSMRDVPSLAIGSAALLAVVHQLLPLLATSTQALVAPAAFLAGAGCMAFRRRGQEALAAVPAIAAPMVPAPTVLAPTVLAMTMPAQAFAPEMRGELASASLAAFGAPPPADFDHHAANALERAASDLKSHPVFTDILSEQLSSVTQTSQDAAGKILAGLMSVDGQIDALMRFIQQSGSNERVSEVVTDIESQIDGCRDQLGRFVSYQAAEAEQVLLQRARLQGETQSVTSALDGIGSIARQTTMLSINVAIQAARAGDVGKGFMVIGTEIRALAQEVHLLAQEINLRIDSLMRTVTVDFQERADSRSAMERSSIDSIVATLDSLAENVTALLTHQRDVLQKVETENEAISRPILDMMGSVQFQDITRQQIEQLDAMAKMVAEHMALLADHLCDPASPVDFEPLTIKLDQLFASYVMDSQRVTHRAVNGQDQGGPPAVAAIELF